MHYTSSTSTFLRSGTLIIIPVPWIMYGYLQYSDSVLSCRFYPVIPLPSRTHPYVRCYRDPTRIGVRSASTLASGMTQAQVANPVSLLLALLSVWGLLCVACAACEKAWRKLSFFFLFSLLLRLRLLLSGRSQEARDVRHPAWLREGQRWRRSEYVVGWVFLCTCNWEDWFERVQSRYICMLGC